MSKKFNLFLLHQRYDVHPRSWICLGGNELGRIIGQLESDIKNKRGICREKISEMLSKKLNCSKNVIKQLFQSKKAFYPIPFILELSKFHSNSKSYLQEILKHVKFLKVNSASAVPVIALSKLSENFCKFLGAFMADGSLSYQIVIATDHKEKISRIKEMLSSFKLKFSEGYSVSRKEFFISFNINRWNSNFVEKLITNLSKEFKIQTHTNIELSDEHKSNVEAFKTWIKTCFGLKPTSFRKRGNAWRVIFSNKILGRYLVTFFDIRPGYKTDIAKEPAMVRYAPFSYRKAFARGVLMFDGGVTISGNIVLSSKSKALVDSIADIFSKDSLSFNRRISRSNYIIYTHKNNNKNKLLNYFEPATWKEVRLRETLSTVKAATFQTYRTYSSNKLTIKSLLKELGKVGACDIIYLMHKFKCRHVTVTNYLRILKNRGLVSLSTSPRKLNLNAISNKTTVFLENDLHNLIFNQLKRKFKRYDKAAEYFCVLKSTFSAWKVKKNRIPLDIIKQFCNNLGLDSYKIIDNVQEVDRNVVELI